MGAAMFDLWLIELSGVVLSCFTLSRFAIFPDVSLIEPEGSFNPLFNAILYSVSWVRKLVIGRLQVPSPEVEANGKRDLFRVIFKFCAE